MLIHLIIIDQLALFTLGVAKEGDTSRRSASIRCGITFSTCSSGDSKMKKRGSLSLPNIKALLSTGSSCSMNQRSMDPHLISSEDNSGDCKDLRN